MYILYSSDQLTQEQPLQSRFQMHHTNEKGEYETSEEELSPTTTALLALVSKSPRDTAQLNNRAASLYPYSQEMTHTPSSVAVSTSVGPLTLSPMSGASTPVTTLSEDPVSLFLNAAPSSSRSSQQSLLPTADPKGSASLETDNTLVSEYPPNLSTNSPSLNSSVAMMTSSPQLRSPISFQEFLVNFAPETPDILYLNPSPSLIGMLASPLQSQTLERSSSASSSTQTVCVSSRTRNVDQLVSTSSSTVSPLGKGGAGTEAIMITQQQADQANEPQSPSTPIYSITINQELSANKNGTNTLLDSFRTIQTIESADESSPMQPKETESSSSASHMSQSLNYTERSTAKFNSPRSSHNTHMASNSEICLKYPCEASGCTRAYLHKKDLIRHMRMVHNSVPERLEATMVVIPPRPNVCGISGCIKSYIHHKDLVRHQRQVHFASSNMNEIQKRYPCDYQQCNKSYIHKKDLIRHKRLFHNDTTPQPSIPEPVIVDDEDSCEESYCGVVNLEEDDSQHSDTRTLHNDKNDSVDDNIVQEHLHQHHHHHHHPGCSIHTHVHSPQVSRKTQSVGIGVSTHDLEMEYTNQKGNDQSKEISADLTLADIVENAISSPSTVVSGQPVLSPWSSFLQEFVDPDPSPRIQHNKQSPGEKMSISPSSRSTEVHRHQMLESPRSLTGMRPSVIKPANQSPSDLQKRSTPQGSLRIQRESTSAFRVPQQTSPHHRNVSSKSDTGTQIGNSFHSSRHQSSTTQSSPMDYGIASPSALLRMDVRSQEQSTDTSMQSSVQSSKRPKFCDASVQTSEVYYPTMSPYMEPGPSSAYGRSSTSSQGLASPMGQGPQRWYGQDSHIYMQPKVTSSLPNVPNSPSYSWNDSFSHYDTLYYDRSPDYCDTEEDSYHSDTCTCGRPIVRGHSMTGHHNSGYYGNYEPEYIAPHTNNRPRSPSYQGYPPMESMRWRTGTSSQLSHSDAKRNHWQSASSSSSRPIDSEMHPHYRSPEQRSIPPRHRRNTDSSFGTEHLDRSRGINVDSGKDTYNEQHRVVRTISRENEQSPWTSTNRNISHNTDREPSDHPPQTRSHYSSNQPTTSSHASQLPATQNPPSRSSSLPPSRQQDQRKEEERSLSPLTLRLLNLTRRTMPNDFKHKHHGHNS